MPNKNDPAIECLLERGIVAARRQSTSDDSARQRQRARALLARVLQADPGNIRAWTWLSRVVDCPAQRKQCLKRLLALDPGNKYALASLDRLDGSRVRPQPEHSPDHSRPGPAAKLRRLGPERFASDLPDCPFCRQPVSATGTRCPHCRLPLAMNCPACGQAMDVEHAACSRCGQVMGNYLDPRKFFARLGKRYLKARRYPDAVKAWQCVAIVDPEFRKLHLRLGQAHLGTGRPDRAEKSLLRALKQSPHDPAANLTMAELLRRRGEAAQAFTHYQTVIRTNPRQGLAWFRLAGLYEQAGQKKAAKRAYRKAVRWLPAGSQAGVRARLKLYNSGPALPETIATGWSEFLRQVSGPILVCVMFALFDSGLRPWWIPLTGWLALFLGHSGAFLFVSGASLPRNPVIQWLTGDQGMRSRGQKLAVALVGALLWLAAMGLILWPINQSFPEMPDSW